MSVGMRSAQSRLGLDMSAAGFPYSAGAMISRSCSRRFVDPSAKLKFVSGQGYRAKDDKPRASGTTVTFADGRNFFLGASDAQSQAPAAPAR